MLQLGISCANCPWWRHRRWQLRRWWYSFANKQKIELLQFSLLDPADDLLVRALEMAVRTKRHSFYLLCRYAKSDFGFFAGPGCWIHHTWNILGCMGFQPREVRWKQRQLFKVPVGLLVCNPWRIRNHEDRHVMRLGINQMLAWDAQYGIGPSLLNRFIQAFAVGS